MDVVQKLWGFCNTLRHDGINYGDYIEQLTFLLFLKLAEEKDLTISAGYDWSSLRSLSGIKLLNHYEDTLHKLAHEPGLLGSIFTGAISRFREPNNLKKLINLIDETEWASLDVDLKGEAYEGLLQKFAAEQKGAGQYFTPRPLIRAIVRCMQPDIREATGVKIHDPACGTGGFLIGAHEWMLATSQGALSHRDQLRLRYDTYSGNELVSETCRLALMNLYIHGIEDNIYCGDSLASNPEHKYHIVLTNPPFGTKGAGEVPDRNDFQVKTPNKQLNFIQHLLTILEDNGRAAMILPDNVLFEEHAGRDVRRLLMANCSLHTILRLPVGTFTPYSTGIRSNVLFFTKGQGTEEIWIYDLRTNMPKVTKNQPLTLGYFSDFISSYGPHPTPLVNDREENERFHHFTRKQVEVRDDNLDILWLKEGNPDESEFMPELEDLLSEIMIKLQTAVDALNEMGMLLAESND